MWNKNKPKHHETHVEESRRLSEAAAHHKVKQAELDEKIDLSDHDQETDMSSGRAKYDPLEAAKLAADGGPAASKPSAPPAPQAAAPSEAKTPSPPATPMAPADAAALAKPAPKVRYKVMNDKRVSVNGQICDWKAGRIVDPAGYGGDAGIAKIVGQGVILEIVEE